MADAAMHGMRGLIRTPDLLLHAVGIIRAFGLRTYVHCVVAAVHGRGRTTFLEAVWESTQPLPARHRQG